MEFLGDHYLGRVSVDDGRIQRQQNGECERLGRRLDGISETDVDLHWYTRTIETCWHSYADTLVFSIFSDARTFDPSQIELKPIVTFNRTNVADCVDHFTNLVGTSAEEIEILGGTVEFAGPCDEKRCTFQYESVLVFGSTKTKQEALNGPAAENELEVLFSLMRDSEEFSPV